jgi:uncharacterized integral membrane protein
MKVFYTVILVLFILFIISFSLANNYSVTLRYYDYLHVETPIYILMFVFFLAGVIFTGFIGIVERFRLTRTITKQNKLIRELRREIRASALEEKMVEPEDLLEEDLKTP